MKCKICGKECDGFKGIGSHIVKAHKMSPEDYFVKYILNDIVPVCYCGKKVGFINLKKGFRKHCSNKCSQNSPEVKKKYKQTCQERFGTEHPGQSKEVKEKRKKTCLKVYGEEHPFASKKVREKIKKTCLKVYQLASENLVSLLRG
jgi:hypothetical protein